jgi:hypothetical protein
MREKKGFIIRLKRDFELRFLKPGLKNRLYHGKIIAPECLNRKKKVFLLLPFLLG